MYAAIAPSPSQQGVTKPLLKWAGGKTQLLSEIIPKIPAHYSRYIELFFGGGAVFFSFRPENGIIADNNPELINLYRRVADDVDGVITQLRLYENTEESFYAVRALDWNKLSFSAAAARTIFLNRSCYNGLYRVNNSGQFNVPYGRYKNPRIIDESALLSASAILKTATIICGDYKSVVRENARRGDFIFLSNNKRQFDNEAREAAADFHHQIESLLSEYHEEEYAARQAIEWEEIAAYMELIIKHRNMKVFANGEEIEIPHSEAPAYFEWILWRAFLAINGMKKKPYEARRFKIDQDFLPVGTAPGGGPDLIFEFSDFVIVVEVTLTGSSRQEAAEGEPVRRHVADLVLRYHEQSGKPVYGLFIANRIDSNTAETFRIGIWFTRSDDKMRLDIIPFTLAQFKELFEALFTTNRVDVRLIRELLDHCGVLRPHHEAPAWKREIDRCISHKIATWSQV